jgi:predicted transport protein
MIFAFFLARENKDLLIGEAMSRRDYKAIYDAVSTIPQVSKIISVRTMHFAPEDVLIAIEVSLADDLNMDAIESITRIVRRNETAREIAQEIKLYSEESHLGRADENIKSLYQEIKSSVFLFGNNIQINPKKLYITFFRNSNFVYVIIRRSRIDLILNLKKGSLIDTKNIAIDVSTTGHWGNGSYLIKMTDSSMLGHIGSLLRQSFDAN